MASVLCFVHFPESQVPQGVCDSADPPWLSTVTLALVGVHGLNSFHSWLLGWKLEECPCVRSPQ